MLEMLEIFIVRWLYLHIAIIMIYFCSFIFINRKSISLELRRNKFTYLALLIIFLIGSSIRIVNVVHGQHIVQDNQEYIIQAAMVADKGEFTYVHDSPAYSVLLSLFISLSDYNPSTGSFVSAIFGGLSIIAIFVFIKMFFRSNLVGIISAVVLTFSNLHYDVSLSGAPFSLSIFLLFVIFIISEYTIRSNKLTHLLLLALMFGFTTQLYYFEVILVFPVILYLILSRSLNKSVSLKLVTFLVILLISILPFAILQYIAPVPENKSRDYYIKPSGFNKIVSLWFKRRAGYVSLESKFHPSAKLNSHDSRLISYLAYLLLGEGRGYESRYFPTAVLHSNQYANYPIYIVYLFLSLTGLVALRVNVRKIVFFLSVFFALLSLFSVYISRQFIYMAYPESLVIIPLISYGICSLIRRLPPLLKLVVGMILVSLVISPFFLMDHFDSYQEFSISNPGNSLNTDGWWSSPQCGSPYILFSDYCLEKYKSLVEQT